MKFTLATLSLIISANVFAYSATDATVLTSASPMLSSAATSDSQQKKEAAALINDVQGYSQLGKTTIRLAQKIKDIQAQDESLSVAEALELIVFEAESILK
jgi:hypothetical protein